MRTDTDRRSFILKPSTVREAGVGVFILHDIAAGAHLELFVGDSEEELCDPNDLPAELRGFCLDQPGGKVLCPVYFNRLDIGNYLNHSIEKQNIRFAAEQREYFALRDLKKGEELFANYNELGEPEDKKDAYYQS